MGARDALDFDEIAEAKVHDTSGVKGHDRAARSRMPPRPNGALTDTLPIVRLNSDGRRCLDLLRWGLVPWWSKDIKIGSHCINAMAETVATKPAFRDPFARGQRCIVPVDGFYEWKKTLIGKQPYAIVARAALRTA
jgi:putative SOS response-associated peptidase YedK